jgi:hypothetical protein
LGDDPSQLFKLVDVTEAHLRRAQDDKDQATLTLKQAQEAMLEKRQVSQKEKDDLQTKFEEEKEQIQ